LLTLSLRAKGHIAIGRAPFNPDAVQAWAKIDELRCTRGIFSNQSAKTQISAGIKPVGGSIFVTELTPMKCQI
ncbi:hypothetical protein, partial [Pseudomonas sp. HY13-MNA-CIBAN-0226]|uniref:hypothetical protein n=1 Tax=Pseudomonas sp. HY13-MNA-CIBAN-0226 TaxID=3140473 RepID=UPI003323899E